MFLEKSFVSHAQFLLPLGFSQLGGGTGCAQHHSMM
jgi:hypothetical protein